MMLIYSIQVSALLTILIEPTFGATGCPVSIFGSSCQYSCNCQHSLDCGVDGSCPNNEPCKRRFYGPGCQFTDLLATQGATSIPTFVNDHNDSTCNPNPNATSVTVTLKDTEVLTWIRIYVSNNITLFYRNFTIHVDQYIARQSKYKVHDTAVDIRCNVPGYRGANITIVGPVAPFICTINVGGGRNVAVNQRVRQSSNYSGDPLFKVRADNAIDGNLTGSCSRTQFETETAYWNVTLDQNYWFLRMVVFNSNVNMTMLSGFKVQAYDHEGPKGTHFIDSSPVPLLVYNIDVHVGGPFREIRIERDHVLMLCEVEIYAVSAVCPAHKYGLECEHQCQCQDSRGCSDFEGTCLHVPDAYCPTGRHGKDCELSCSENCQNNLCDAHSGACFKCKPGYLGEFCNQHCPSKTYGPNCSLTCPEKCTDPCKHIDGSCTCSKGFAGPLCAECGIGWFGDNCTRACPKNCLDKKCSNITGECVSCLVQWKGPECQDKDILGGFPFYWFLIPIFPFLLLTLYCFGFRRRPPIKGDIVRDVVTAE